MMDVWIGGPPATALVVPASGDTTGAADKAAINAALVSAAAGGTVLLKPASTYWINGPLVIPLAAAGLTFDLNGATVALAAGSNCQLLWDAAHAAGTLTVPSPMGSYTVRNGTFDKGANTGGNNGLHSVILGGTNVRVSNLWMKSTAGKYAILLQNVVGATVENIEFNTASDGLHVQGPASHVRVRGLRGTTGDDMFAITACDYAAYTWGNEGDVSDVQVDGISLTGGNARAAIVLSGRRGGTTALTVSDVRIANINATQSATNVSPLVIIGEDTAQATTKGGNLKRVTIDGLSGVLNSGGTQHIVSIQYASDSTAVFEDITIRNVKWVGDAQNGVLVSAKVNCLTVDGFRGATATGAGNIVSVNNSATWASVGRLTISNVDVTNPGARGGSVLRNSATGAVVGEVFLRDIRLDNFSWVADLISSTTVRMHGGSLTNMGGLFNVRSPAAVTVAAWSGVVSSATSSTITATGTVRSLAAEFPLDLNNAQVAKNNGDRATARVTAGTIAAGSVAEYNTAGAHWYSTNGTLL